MTHFAARSCRRLQARRKGRGTIVIGMVSTEKVTADPAVGQIVDENPSAHKVRSGQAFLVGELGAEGGI